MELQRSVQKPRIVRKLTLELYLQLKHLDVIAPSVLQKIIAMHGFNSYKVPKDDLMDAVRSIDLMDLKRSTLDNEDVSSCAFLSLAEVVKDLNILHWQECCITSLETINSVNFDLSAGVDSSAPAHLKLKCNSGSSSKDSTSAADIDIAKPKGVKRKKLTSLYD